MQYLRALSGEKHRPFLRPPGGYYSETLGDALLLGGASGLKYRELLGDAADFVSEVEVYSPRNIFTKSRKMLDLQMQVHALTGFDYLSLNLIDHFGTPPAESGEYLSLLNLNGDSVMGYVEIPLIQVNLPIYHGTDSDVLDAGIGHLLGTSLPVGGMNTHSVLTAHSGMANQKMFSDLDKLDLGDVFYLQVLGETLAYQVDQINTVLPHDTTYLGIEEGMDICTLVTCTPFGVNTHRLLVRGFRIPYEEAEVIVEEQLQVEEPPKSTWEEQYIKGILLGIGAVILIACLYFYFQYRRKHRPKRVSHAEKQVRRSLKRKRGKYEAD